MSRRAEGPDSASARAIAWALIVACVPGPVFAAPPSESAPVSESQPSPEPSSAVEWYARGIELAQAEDYLGAAEAFLQSYQLKPTPEALFNAALAYETGKRPLEAIVAYRRHLAEPKANPEQQARARASIDALLREVAMIKGLRFDPERAPVEIRINGQAHSIEEFPLPLMPGEIEVEIVDAQGVHGRERYSVGAGEALVLDLRALWPEPEVEPEVVPEPEPKPEPEPEVRPDPSLARRAKALQISTWTGMGLTGAGLIAFGIAGGLALDYHRREGARVCEDGDCPDGWPTDRAIWIERMDRAELATNVALSVTAVLAVSTLAVGIAAIQSTRQARRGGQVRSATRMRVRVSGLGIEF